MKTRTTIQPAERPERLSPGALPSRQTYTAARVCAAAGIKLTTLRTWRARGLIVVSKKSEQDWTRYSEIHALQVCVLAALGRYGFDLEIGAFMFRDLDLQLDDRLYDGKPLYLTMSMSERFAEGGKQEVRAATDLSRSIYVDDLLEGDPNNAVAIVVDLAKIFRRALAILREES